MKKYVWWILAFVLVAGLGYGGYRVYRSVTTPAATQSAALKTVLVERGDLRAEVDASGNLAAAEEVQLSFASSGEVAEVLVAVGDVVAAGQPLVRLDTDDLEDAVAQAELSLSQAKIDLSETLAGATEEALTSAAAALRGAQADYAKAAGAATQDELEKATVELRQAEVSRDAAQAGYDRAGGSWRNEVNYSQIANNLWTAQAGYEKAQASYNATVDGATDNERWAAWAKVQQAEANVEKLRSQPADEAVSLAQIKVQQAEYDLAQAEYNLAQATLESPLAGTVTAVNVAVGERASTPAVVVATLEALTVELVLDESDVVQVVVGQLVVVALDALDDVELTGAVTYIASTAQIQSGVVLYPVTVTLDSTDAPVRAGMTADAEIITAEAAGVLLLPSNAVQELNGRTIVMRKLAEGETLERTGLRPGAGSGPGAENNAAPAGATGAGPGNQMGAGGFVPVPVEVGASSSTQVEIVSGLEEGDEVVIINLAELAESGGMPSGMMMMRDMMGRHP
ncbi:MAG: HlyD family efflux transporter periplasmic adaptor subunit [Chloroflexota bacterium]|nr:HlyD family efflux transporter periplasmic adaptor subunit [Chloroflexota bacterium]